MNNKRQLIVIGLIAIILLAFSIFAYIVISNHTEEEPEKVTLSPTSTVINFNNNPTIEPVITVSPTEIVLPSVTPEITEEIIPTEEITAEPTPINEVETTNNITFEHLEILTYEQKVNKVRFKNLITEAASWSDTKTHGKIKSVTLLDKSTISEVYTTVEFADGFTRDYVATYDDSVYHNFLRSGDAESYEMTMAGENAG